MFRVFEVQYFGVHSKTTHSTCGLPMSVPNAHTQHPKKQKYALYQVFEYQKSKLKSLNFLLFKIGPFLLSVFIIFSMYSAVPCCTLRQQPGLHVCGSQRQAYYYTINKAQSQAQMCLLSSYPKRELNLQLTLALLASSFFQALSVILGKWKIHPCDAMRHKSPISHTICKLSLHKIP